MDLFNDRLAYEDSISTPAVGRKVRLINASKVVPTSSLRDEYSVFSPVWRTG